MLNCDVNVTRLHAVVSEKLGEGQDIRGGEKPPGDLLRPLSGGDVSGCVRESFTIITCTAKSC